jgi:HPt (histidine-containing phosphotransfer) domain-containing protein
VIKELVLPGPEVPVIDETRLLDEFGGDREILAELRDLFLAQAPPLHAAIIEAMDAGDLSVLVKDAHSLKGACATYGAPRLTMVCKEIELSGKAGDLETARAWRAAFEQEFAALSEGITRIAQN